ncbi:MAG TPA: hypothetical protein VF193_15050 [Steroidobacter sp.]
MITRRELLKAAAGVSVLSGPSRALGQWVSAPAPSITVRIDPTARGEIDRGAFGVAVPFWKSQPAEETGFVLLKDADVRFLAFDSGMAVDLYDWRTNRLKRDPQNGRRFMSYEERLQPRYRFETFVAQAKRIGAEMMVYANYGTGSAEEAAAWVAHANKEKGYGVRYWEIGQCLWGNGYFKEIGHEPDAHADKSPAAYARAALEFCRAMKRVDPTIKVGVGLAPAFSKRFPERYADFIRWNETVLDIAGKEIDFADVFFYPGPRTQLSDADMLAAPHENATDIQLIRRLVAAHETASHKIELIMGECNSASGAHTQQIGQAGALFLADHFMTMYEIGLSRVIWYAMYSGIQGGGVRGHGDLGMFASGDCSWHKTAATSNTSAYCQPAAHTPFRTYDGMKMLSRVATPGSQILQATVDDPMVGVHCVRHDQRTMSILFVNKDPGSTRAVKLDAARLRVGPEATVHYYGPASRSVEQWTIDMNRLGERPLVLQPFSLTALLLRTT